ncbi:MAG: hypothetical protein VB144_08625 [Clostridia bacterium]|nr:hypothetical protein [Clostridia bacterium]
MRRPMSAVTEPCIARAPIAASPRGAMRVVTMATTRAVTRAVTRAALGLALGLALLLVVGLVLPGAAAVATAETGAGANPDPALSVAEHVRDEAIPDAGIAVNKMISLAHLDYLRDEIKLTDGRVIPIWWVYCEPTASGDRNSKYKYVEAASEGVSCVDDVARAALAYLADYERTGIAHDLDMARDAFKFIEYMRTPEGHFYNFILESGARNLKGATSEKGVNWWTARAMWALARGIRVFSAADPGYAAHLEELIGPSLSAVRQLLTGNELSMYGQHKTLHGARIPAWFVGDGSDASSVVVMALCELYQARPTPEIAEMVQMFADGIAEYQAGSPDEPPFGAHLPWGGSISYWHGWGSNQMRALAMAGQVFGNRAWIESAEREANWLVTHMQASLGVFAHLGPTPLEYVQLAYGCQAITTGLLELYRATGKNVYAVLAGVSASWLNGNNVANYPMYDPSTGRGWDGIDPPGAERGIGVSFNSGAESTIEAATTLIELARVPLAWEYAGLRTRARHPFRVVEAESFDKAATGKPRKMWASWTGEGIPSGEFYVSARSGDSFKLTFSIPEDDVFIPYVTYERQPALAGQVGMSFSLDGAEPIVCDMGGSPDSKYFVMEKLSSPVTLAAGKHTITVKFTGASRTASASIDAIILQPTVEWRQMSGSGSRNLLIARSFREEASARDIDVDIRSSSPGPEISFLVRRYNSNGELAGEERIARQVPPGSESLKLGVPVEPYGYTLAEWR